MAAVDDTVPPSTGAILVEPVRNNFRAIKGKIDALPDALDPGGNECTALAGRAVVIGMQGAKAVADTDDVSFGGAITSGARLKIIVVSANLALSTAHLDAVLLVTSGTDVVLTADAASVPNGWYCSVIRGGAGEVAIATSGGLVLRNSYGHTRVDKTYQAVTLIREGSDLYLLGPTKA